MRIIRSMFAQKILYQNYGQLTLKAPIPAWSPKLSNDGPVQYLHQWQLKQQQVL